MPLSFSSGVGLRTTLVLHHAAHGAHRGRVGAKSHLHLERGEGVFFAQSWNYALYPNWRRDTGIVFEIRDNVA